MAWTSPRTWVSGETLTAALLNVHVRDNFKAIGDPWTAYGTSTTILTASTTNPTLGSGSSATAFYILAGKLVHFRIQIICGTSGVAAGSGTYQFLLPATPQAGSTLLASGYIQDGSGAAATVGSLIWSSGTIGHYYQTGLAATTSSLAQATANRRYMINGAYEGA